MTDRDRTNDDQQARRQGEPDAQQSNTRGKDVMRGRSFAGANIANTQEGETIERQRVVDLHGEEPDDFVTDAEIEAREREKNED